MTEPVRIAMWSGPRNISTALMRSFGSRADTAVVDEPLYAHYLEATGANHPGRDEVIARHETDWRKVVASLTGPAPEGRRVFYQKHMAHHLLPGMERAWVRGLTNCFLIRDPVEVITSFVKVVADPTPDELGLPQQWELFESERDRTGQTPPVIDSRDVLADPAAMLALLCERVGIPFDAAMLRWHAGPRETDGVWGPHWYASVYRSTGFEPYRAKEEPVPARLAGVYERCRMIYARLAEHRLRVQG